MGNRSISLSGANLLARRITVLLHRWIGLLMAVFLIIVGITGSILAFKEDIERFLTPDLFAIQPHSEAGQLDLATLAEMAERADPRIRVGYFSISEYRADMKIAPRTDPATGKPFNVGFHEMYLDPWTGKILGRDGESFSAKIIPFIYDLHTNLLLGEWGAWTLGITALAWTIDCFNAIYLTFPIVLRRFFPKWLTAWKIKWPASAFRLNFDLHRASGLWFTPLLLIFAWSSVMFNLGDVYNWTMGKIFRSPMAMEDNFLKTIHPPHPSENPKLNWHEALAKSQQYIEDIAKKDGITIIKPFGLAYLTNPGVYSYDVESSANISRGIWTGGLGIWIDGQTGELQRIYYPTEDDPASAIGTWLYVLHFANLYGWMAYRILTCVLGAIITMLSITGIYIWWKKRRARQFASERQVQT